MSVAVASVEKINALKTGIEATTGESYNDLTEAVQGLKNGYGQSGGGEIGKPYIDTSKVTDFSYLCVFDRFANELENIDTSNAEKFTNMFSNCNFTTIPLIDTSNAEKFSNMFDQCKQLTTVPSIDTSKGIYFDFMFNNCVSLTVAPILDTGKGNIFERMFQNCSKLKIIPLLDISNGTNNKRMFTGCSVLENINITTRTKRNLETDTFYDCTALTNLTIGEGWAVSIYLTYSPNLTVESLHGMIENLADLTGATAKTFSVGETNLSKIDEEHIAMLTAKNWVYS